MANELLAELSETEVKTLEANTHIGALLSPHAPPQSQTLKTLASQDSVQSSQGNTKGSKAQAAKALRRESVRKRNAEAEELHINLMKQAATGK